jgi:hypothetical protein
MLRFCAAVFEVIASLGMGWLFYAQTNGSKPLAYLT